MAALSLVKALQPEPEMVEREKARARTIASIGRTPSRADKKHYPDPHEAVILRVKEALEV